MLCPRGPRSRARFISSYMHPAVLLQPRLPAPNIWTKAFEIVRYFLYHPWHIQGSRVCFTDSRMCTQLFCYIPASLRQTFELKFLKLSAIFLHHPLCIQGSLELPHVHPAVLLQPCLHAPNIWTKVLKLSTTFYTNLYIFRAAGRASTTPACAPSCSATSLPPSAKYLN